MWVMVHSIAEIDQGTIMDDVSLIVLAIIFAVIPVGGNQTIVHNKL